MRRRSNIFNSCAREVAAVLDDLSEDACEVEIRLVSGSECCEIEGIICGISKSGCILELIDTKNDRKCFIPIDKIAAICKKCQGR